MSFVLPEIVMQRLITIGLKQLRANKPAFYDLFCQYTQDELEVEYGTKYVDDLWDWFSTTKLPVLKAWSFNAQKVPCFSIHLATEQEDEGKAAIGDYAGDFTGEAETGTGVFTVMLDIGIHANKAGDHVLWMYYILSYILFKNKMMADRLGLKLHTFSASDYNKEAKYMAENVWTRWVRFRCTTQNFWSGDSFNEIDDLNTDWHESDQPYSDIAASLDVDITEVSTTTSPGLRASRAGDDEGEEDQNI